MKRRGAVFGSQVLSNEEYLKNRRTLLCLNMENFERQIETLQNEIRDLRHWLEQDIDELTQIDTELSQIENDND